MSHYSIIPTPGSFTGDLWWYLYINGQYTTAAASYADAKLKIHNHIHGYPPEPKPNYKNSVKKQQLNK